MSTLQQKVEAMEKVGAGAVAEHTLQKLIGLHVQKYERYVIEGQRELTPSHLPCYEAQPSPAGYI